MKMPNIPNPIRDAEGDVTYVVMAYRKLTRGEIVQAVRVYRSQHKRKPKKGTKVTIYSLHGAV